jgi:hypothetical protein
MISLKIPRGFWNISDGREYLKFCRVDQELIAVIKINSNSLLVVSEMSLLGGRCPKHIPRPANGSLVLHRNSILHRRSPRDNSGWYLKYGVYGLCGFYVIPDRRQSTRVSLEQPDIDFLGIPSLGREVDGEVASQDKSWRIGIRDKLQSKRPAGVWCQKKQNPGEYSRKRV